MRESASWICQSGQSKPLHHQWEYAGDKKSQNLPCPRVTAMVTYIRHKNQSVKGVVFWMDNCNCTHPNSAWRSNKRPKVFNCKYGLTLELLVYILQWNCHKSDDLVTTVIFKLTFEKSSSRSNTKLGWYGLRQPCSMVNLVWFPRFLSVHHYM